MVRLYEALKQNQTHKIYLNKKVTKQLGVDLLMKGEEFQITNVLHMYSIVNHIYCHNFNTNVM